MKIFKSMFWVALMLALPALAQPQTVWRCGADGRSYSDTPCPKGRSLETVRARPGDEVAAAQAKARRDNDRADSATKERLAREAASRGNGLAALGPQQQEAAVRPKKSTLRQRQTEPRKAQRRPSTAASGTSPAIGRASRRAQG